MARPKRGYRVPDGLIPLSFEEAWDLMTADEQNSYIDSFKTADGIYDWEDLSDEAKTKYIAKYGKPLEMTRSYDEDEFDYDEEPFDYVSYVDRRPTLSGVVPDDYISDMLPVMNRYLFYEPQRFDIIKTIFNGDCVIDTPIRVRSTILLAYVFMRLREKKLIAATWHTTIEQFCLFLSAKGKSVTSKMLRDSVQAIKSNVHVRNKEKIDKVL